MTRDIKRTEVLSVRIDPKLRYLAELAARQQRRNLSSFTEWAIEEALTKVIVGQEGRSLADLGNYLWDVYEPDRFIKLALDHENLLTHEEQVIRKLIFENPYFWNWEEKDGRKIPKWEFFFIDLDRLREEWPKLLAVARGQASRDTLPTTKPESTSKGVKVGREHDRSTTRKRG